MSATRRLKLSRAGQEGRARSRVERDKNLAPNGLRAAREIGDANEIELWDCASRVGLPSTFTDDTERDGSYSRACKEVSSSNRQGLSAARAWQSGGRS